MRTADAASETCGAKRLMFCQSPDFLIGRAKTWRFFSTFFQLWSALVFLPSEGQLFPRISLQAGPESYRNKNRPVHAVEETPPVRMLMVRGVRLKTTRLLLSLALCLCRAWKHFCKETLLHTVRLTFKLRIDSLDCKHQLCNAEIQTMILKKVQFGRSPLIELTAGTGSWTDNKGSDSPAWVGPFINFT